MIKQCSPAGLHHSTINQPKEKEMTTYTRKQAQVVAGLAGIKYRITKDGEVHFYGTMPNSNTVGWYLAGYAAAGEV
jgi:hypothetical protein